MTVRVWNLAGIHLWAADPEDERIAWTLCGVRFCWGRLPARAGDRRRCGVCFVAGAPDDREGHGGT